MSPGGSYFFITLRIHLSIVYKTLFYSIAANHSSLKSHQFLFHPHIPYPSLVKPLRTAGPRTGHACALLPPCFFTCCSLFPEAPPPPPCNSHFSSDQTSSRKAALTTSSAPTPWKVRARSPSFLLWCVHTTMMELTTLQSDLLYPSLGVKGRNHVLFVSPASI